MCGMSSHFFGTALLAAMACVGCGSLENSGDWKGSVNQQVNQLGYRNWIVVSEASFPAHSRPGTRQVIADAEVPEVVDYVLNALEQTQHVRPQIYLTREMRSVENDFAPGIEAMRERIRSSLHGHEPTELDQQSLITLLESANQSYDVLVIRTPTALPYTSVFLELQPGYWDAESEDRLRERIKRERMERLARPIP
jgi:L-fucose mutarotase/ribose pyranase (RbsD/FucU family)